MFNLLAEKIESHASAADIFRAFFLSSRHSYWLDSSRVDTGYSRFSFMGDSSGPYAHLVRHTVGEAMYVHSESRGETAGQGDIFRYLEDALANTRLTETPNLPFNFVGGYVGYLGYELMAVTEFVTGHSSALPNAVMLFSDRFIVIDHLENVTYAVVLYKDDRSEAENWIRASRIRLQSLRSTPPPPRATICSPAEVEKYLVHDKRRYLANISQCQEKIKAGESYEVCLTNRLRVPLCRYDARELFEAYLILRETNPAPYACFLKTETFAVMCSSPERFLKIDSHGQVEARPIKGTMPRDRDPERDQANRIALGNEERFFSENLMIVDLLRNDLSRSCAPGSISVPALMKVESYATVHQLVSTIRGRLREGVVNCIENCFPGGSMTGAPKKRTLEIINDIEGMPRGIYSGAIGYLSLNASADLNIVIRTIVVHQDVAEIGVGGAITYLSDPQQEYDEMLLKGLAPLSAIRTLMKDPDTIGPVAVAGTAVYNESRAEPDMVHVK
jgi:para-aminobenzoate synthetase